MSLVACIIMKWGGKKNKQIKALRNCLHSHCPENKKKTFPLKKSPLFMLHPQLSTTALK